MSIHDDGLLFKKDDKIIILYYFGVKCPKIIYKMQYKINKYKKKGDLDSHCKDKELAMGSKKSKESIASSLSLTSSS